MRGRASAPPPSDPARARAPNQLLCLCPPPAVFCPKRGRQAMQGFLGEKIGEGASADVHAWAPGQVVKLFRAASSRRLGWHEAHMTDAVFAAGAPAPQVFGVV